MNNALIIGVILIIAGFGLAVIAYMVITSSDEEDDTEEEQLEQPVEATPVEAQPTEDEQTEQTDEVVEEPEQEEPEISPDLEPAVVEADEQDLPEPPAEEPEPAMSAPQAQLPEAPSASAERIQVATLLRDDVSGDLIIRIGDREYTSADELRASSDWTRIEYAASDLSEWIKQPAPETSADKETAAVSEAQAADRKPSTMIEQINSILQQMIEDSDNPELAVRLIEGPGGMARVLIGVNSYEIGEVPDAEVQDLIRSAVASWESSQ